ncbi:hypothetical protein [Rhizobium chutanense]|nr:hypothetical protein [Rhizobium chutanense]
MLDAILDAQAEGAAGAVIEEWRIKQALTNGPSFTDAEKRILWLSPDTRALFMDIRREVRSEVRAKASEAGYGAPIRLLAASGDRREERIDGSGWSLWIFHDDIPGSEWSLSLELAENYVALLPKKMAVKLKDSGEKTWISGLPDGNRRIDAVWDEQKESPFERLRHYALSLDP